MRPFDPLLTSYPHLVNEVSCAYCMLCEGHIDQWPYTYRMYIHTYIHMVCIVRDLT